MREWMERVRRIGWFVVEAAFLLVALCVLLEIVLGPQAGGFVSGVAERAKMFLQAVPSGVALGVAILVFLYLFIASKK